MRPRVFLLGFLFAIVFLLPPSLPAKGKTKPASSQKISQDFSKFVEVTGADKVGQEQCAQCHADLSKTFRRSPHAMQDVACEQCHGAGSLHVAEGAYSKEKIISFRDRSAEDRTAFA